MIHISCVHNWYPKRHCNEIFPICGNNHPQTKRCIDSSSLPLQLAFLMVLLAVQTITPEYLADTTLNSLWLDSVFNYIIWGDVTRKLCFTFQGAALFCIP